MPALISDTLNHYKFLITLLHKPLTRYYICYCAPRLFFFKTYFPTNRTSPPPPRGIVICTADIWPLQLPPEGFSRLGGKEQKKITTLKGLPFPNRIRTLKPGSFPRL